MDYQVAFKDVPSSEALENAIAGQVGQLEERCPRVQSCRVVVARPHARGRKGYVVHVQLNLARGQEINAYLDDANAVHHDPYLAVRKAFKAASRMVHDEADKRRTRAHPAQEHLAPA